jgi:hypothetical protein
MHTYLQYPLGMAKKEDVMLFIQELFQKLRSYLAAVYNVRMFFFATSNCFDSDKSSLSETLTLAEGLICKDNRYTCLVNYDAHSSKKELFFHPTMWHYTRDRGGMGKV